MRADRTLVVAKRVLRQLGRDRRSIAVVLMQPILIMGIFGYAFGGDVTDAKVALANLDRGTLASDVLANVDASVIRFIVYETETEVERAVRAQTANVGIVFPMNFSGNMRSLGTPGADTAYVIIFEDNTNPQITGAVLEEILDALDKTLEDEFDTSGSFALDERPIFGGEEASSLEFLTPGVAAYAIFMLGTMLTVVAVVKERTIGTIDRVLASPAKRSEVVFGYALAYGLFSLAQAASVLLIAVLLFGVTIAGSVLLALAAATLVGFSALGLGILLSGIARNEQQATQSVFLVAFPALFLAGVFAPLESLPAFFRPFAQVVPLTYAVRALRGIINYGFGFQEVAADLAILAAFAISFLAGAALSFGRKRR